MIKKILYGAIFLTLFVIGIMVYFLNPAVKIIANSFLSNTLETQVVIEEIELDTFELKVKASDVKIKDLKGFRGNVIQIKEINLDIDSVENQKIIIDELSISGMAIKIKIANRQVNIQKWQQHLQVLFARNQSNNAHQNQDAKASSPQRLIINELTISGITLAFNYDSLTRLVNLPDIKIKDFGKSIDGVLLQHLTPSLLQFIIDSAITETEKLTTHALKNMVKKKVKDKQGELLQQIVKRLFE